MRRDIDMMRVVMQWNDKLDDARRRASGMGIAVPSDFSTTVEDAMIEGPVAGALASTFLTDLTHVAGGEEIVRAALDQPPSQTADFGLLTVQWFWHSAGSS